MLIHLSEFGGDREDDIGCAEADVGKKHSDKSHLEIENCAQKCEEQHQREGCDDFGIYDGNIGNGLKNPSGSTSEVIHTDGSNCSQNGRKKCGQRGDKQRIAKTLHQHPVSENLAVPSESESVKIGGGVCIVEGKYHKHRNGCIEEHKNEEHIEFAGKMKLFHTPTASSSPN